MPPLKKNEKIMIIVILAAVAAFVILDPYHIIRPAPDKKAASSKRKQAKKTDETKSEVDDGAYTAERIELEGWKRDPFVQTRPDLDQDAMISTLKLTAISVRGIENGAKVLEGPVPSWKYFSRPGTGNGSAGSSFGLPRFEHASFLARFPFGTVILKDDDIPLEIKITGWSPFIPGDSDNASLPVGALEYSFVNPKN